MASLRKFDTVYFDGTCGLCHWFVRLLLLLDPEGRSYRFAHGGQDTVVVVTTDGQRLIRSSAVLYAFQQAGGWWAKMASLCRIFPLPLRDWAYDLVARNRRRIVKTCPLMPPEFRERFQG